MTGKNFKTLGALALVVLALTGCSSTSDNPSPTAVDQTPPAVPASVDGQSYGGEIVVSWAANTSDADLAGYNVYRVSNGRVAAMNDAPQAETRYVDTHPQQGTNTYRVTSVDASGNESAYQSVQVNLEEDYGPYHPDQP